MACKCHSKLQEEKCICLNAQIYSRSDHDHDRNGTDGYRYTHLTLQEGLIEFPGENISQGQVA